VAGEFRWSMFDYDDDVRDSDGIQVGLSADKVFSPGLQGRARAGYEMRSYDASGIDDSNEPYVDVAVEAMPAQGTTLTAGVGYAIALTPTSAFTSQNRTTLHAAITQKLAPKLSGRLAAAYSTGEFDMENATTEEAVDGDEDVTRVSANLSYQLNRKNALELGWQFVDLTSDPRPFQEFDRNRVHLGWRTQL
jgi:hypothetical protein